MSTAEILEPCSGTNRLLQLETQKNLSDAQRDFLFDHIEKTKKLEIEDQRYSVDVIKGDDGPAFVDIYYMSNGLHYPVITSIPDKQKTDIGVEMTTAWGTSAKVKSHNGRSLGVFVKEGFPGIMFGPPRVTLPKSPLRYAMPVILNAYTLAAEEVSMDADIAAYHLIANDIYSRHNYIFNGELTMRYGESRGIMEGLGSTAIDSINGTKTVWLEGIDPCIPEEITINELATDIKDVGEVTALLTTIRHILTETRRLKYIDTIDLSLEYLIPALATKNTLFSGRAGDFAANIPDDTQGNIVFFDSSVANRYSVFEDKLGHAQNVYTELLKGGHITLAAREMVYRAASRMVAARNAVERFGSSLDSDVVNQILLSTPDHKPKIKPSSKLQLVS